MQAVADHLGNRARVTILGAIVGVAALLILTIGGRPAASEAATATASRSVTVKIKNFAFVPHTLSVSKGTRVVWVNRDGVKHTATRGGSFTTGKIKPGRAVAVRFGAKGTYGYFCKIHPEMRGKVIVG